MVGKTILHYEIIEKLGEGGMGIVYKAEDSKLNRLVAIKVLPPHLLVSEDDRARFNREAKAAAALHHSNIATVFEINESDGKPFIVMEYVEGQTLDKAVETQNLLPLQDAISITIQIADGLGAAHKKDVVHRDIKASNILYSEDKKAKILDFGLAKTSMSTKLTQMGTTIGTVAYMSPEQVRGEEVDHRTDLWSLGVLLYEMIAGHLPFKAEYDQAIFYSIENENPDPITAIRTGIPMALEWIVNKLMAKDPAERYQSANDLIIDLKAVDLNASGFSRISQTTSQTTTKRKFKWERSLFLTIIVVLLITIIFFQPWEWQKQQKPQVVRFAINYTDDGLLSTTGMPLAISPDGTKIVYATEPKQLYVRYVNDLLNSKLIPGTEGARNPSFSPDGNWIVFWANGSIKKVSLTGGKPQLVFTLSDLNQKTAHHWLEDNTIIFSQQHHNNLFRINETGGVPKELNEADSSSSELVYPWLFPDGKSVLLRFRDKPDGEMNQALFDLKSGKYTIILEKSGYARYVPSGHLIYGSNGDLLAVPFDVKERKITGQAVPVVTEISTKEEGYTTIFSVSDNGTLVYPQGDVLKSEKGHLAIVNLSGNSEKINTPGKPFAPRISPDGQSCAFFIKGKKLSIWLYDFKTKITRRLTDEREDDIAPIWSANGKQIIFATKRFSEQWNLASIPIDGSQQPEHLQKSVYLEAPSSLSPDGQNLIYIRQDKPGKEEDSDIFILALNGDNKPIPFLKTPDNEGSASLSPDGKWMVYSSDLSGRNEIYIRPFPGPGGFRQISTDGGIEPCWAPDGRTLYYRTNKGKKLYQVSFKSTTELVVGNPQLLLENKFWRGYERDKNYDISPDGKYFLIPEFGLERDLNQFVVVLNWFEELKRKMASVEEN